MKLPAHIERGRPHPLGATVRDGGVNFAVFSAHAERIELCVFEQTGAVEVRRYDLPERTDDVVHGFLPEVGAGLVYGLRAHGPYAPHRGHRFNPHKLLLDPYAREIVGRWVWHPSHFGYEAGHPDGHRSFDARDNARLALKARVAAPVAFDAGARPFVRDADRVVYEVHVKGYTRLMHEVPEPLRGTYAGFAHPNAIAHLRALGVTTVSLLPVHARIDEAHLAAKHLTNYWGYNTIGFFAPEARYATRPDDPTAVAAEFRAMVRALHDAGLEVLIDVVYNHTAEADESGPTVSMRGLDHASYYRARIDDPARCENWTGCGNTLDLRHPRVRQLVLDSLRCWVVEFGVDGFRFDLAPVLGRDSPSFDARHAFFTALAQDPVLAAAVCVAEPWDLGPDGYRLGHFPRPWLEWNDKFRDTARRAFVRGDVGRGEFARRLTASSDVFDHAGRRPSASVNYVCAHDGWTLADALTYTVKRNHANGEDNRDGRDGELSANGGIEGETDDAHVRAWRARLRRTSIATLVLAQGTPMLRAGDEVGQSQGGNNNAYCQDNATSWIDWAHADADLLAFTRDALALRRTQAALRHDAWWQPGELTWLDVHGPMTHDGWHDPHRRALGVRIAPHGARAVVLLFNPEHDAVRFALPAGSWRVQLDSSAMHPAASVPHDTIEVSAHSVVALVEGDPV